MSKTKRDRIRGRYNAAAKEFWDVGYRKVYRKFYTYKGPVGMQHDQNNWEVVWHWVTERKWEMHGQHPIDRIPYLDQMACGWNMSRNPSWWNRLFHTRPNRKRDRNLLRKYGIKHDAECDAEFSLHKKPNKYYW